MAAVVAGPDAGALLDPFGGAADVEAGVVRLVRPDAFEEDATRLVRASRYVVRLGATADPTLVRAAKAACRGGFVTLTGPTRMVDALSRVFEESEPAAVVSLLADWGVLAALEPGLAAEQARVRAAWMLVEDEARDADRVALGLGLIASGLDPARRIGWFTEAGLARGTIKSALAAADGPVLARSWGRTMPTSILSVHACRSRVWSQRAVTRPRGTLVVCAMSPCVSTATTCVALRQLRVQRSGVS